MGIVIGDRVSLLLVECGGGDGLEGGGVMGNGRGRIGIARMTLDNWRIDTSR